MIFTIAATLAFLWFPGEPRETQGTFCTPQPLPSPRHPNSADPGLGVAVDVGEP